MEENKILNIINKIKTEALNTSELNFLIKHCYQISSSIIKVKFASKINFYNDTTLSIEDIAMDAIVPLFVNNKDSVIGIKRSLEHWNNKIESVSDAEYFLSKIIWRRTEQTVTKLIKQHDPIFEKIHKTLSICISTNTLRKERYLGTVYVVEDTCEKITGHLIPEKDFNSIPSIIFELKQLELFNKLFEYLTEETNFFPAIPLNYLVRRIKNLYFQKYNNEFSTNHYIDDSFITNDIVKQGLESLSEKLETFYVAKNIVSEDDAEKILASFNDISLDIKHGGMHSSLFSYLKYRKKELSKEEFYNNYHHIMNYLFKHFKLRVQQIISM